MSMFKKPRKQIQRRVFSEHQDEEEEKEDQSLNNRNEEDSTFKQHKKEKKPKCATTKQPVLSFEADLEEEGEVFQVKKSSHSKKLMRMYEKERKQKAKNEFKSKQQNLPPVLKTNNTEAATTTAFGPPAKEIITDDLVLVVNSNHNKPPTPPPPPMILSGRAALCAGKDDMSSEEDDEDVSAAHKFSKPNDSFKSVLESGAIPDAAMIHAARKRRQRAREMGGDFMPLEEEEPEDKGRLLREDDHEGSDEERIDMGANPVIRDQERRREQFYEAQESDQELVDEWEDQQIRKGVTGATLPQELIYDYQPTGAVPTQPYQFQTKPKLKIEPGVPRTPQNILEKLREHYQTVCESRDGHRNQLEQNYREIDMLTNELEDMKIRAPKAAEKFRFYQELRGYVTDLVECLDEKISAITVLEQKALDLMARRADWLIERRRQDVRDQADEITSFSKVRREEDEEKNRRAVEREGRRTRRRRARESTTNMQPAHHQHVEGMSTDDEIPQQNALDYEKEREQIEHDVKHVFEDVVDDYSTVANVLIKFEQWRETDMTSYTEAYATMCLPRVVAPLIRLQLIFWDPLNESVELEKMTWYRTLALYGLHDDETESSLAQDPDVNLLPSVVERLLLPKLTHMVDRCWDPLSSTQTLRLIGIVGRYVRRFPTLGPDSKTLHNLFNGVLHKIKRALEHDVFVPVVPKLAENKSPFFQRQFASSLKLLRNITSWQGILNDGTLKDLALNALLNRYLLSAVKFCQLTDAVRKIALINLILPRVWLQGDTGHLQMYSACVNNLMQQLDKDNPLHLESIETLGNILKSFRSS